MTFIMYNQGLFLTYVEYDNRSQSSALSFGKDVLKWSKMTCLVDKRKQNSTFFSQKDCAPKKHTRAPIV